MSFSTPPGGLRGRAIKAQARQERIKQDAAARQAMAEAFGDEKPRRRWSLKRVASLLRKPDR